MAGAGSSLSYQNIQLYVVVQMRAYTEGEKEAAHCQHCCSRITQADAEINCCPLRQAGQSNSARDAMQTRENMGSLAQVLYCCCGVRARLRSPDMGP